VAARKPVHVRDSPLMTLEASATAIDVLSVKTQNHGQQPPHEAPMAPEAPSTALEPTRAKALSYLSPADS
jgi:hypothetical protein